jgi:group I intron endonuclease
MGYNISMIKKLLAKNPGVYMIFNKLNNAKYIGATPRKIYNRFGEHRWALRNNRHGNSILQDAWNKYGEESFEFAVLENTNVNIREREVHWYNHYREIGDKLYNQVNPKDGGRPITHRQRTILKMSKSQKARFGNMTKKEKKQFAKPIIECWKTLDRSKLVSEGYHKRNENREPIYLLSPEGEKVGIKHRYNFAIENGLDPSAITKVIKGNRISHKGWKLHHSQTPM